MNSKQRYFLIVGVLAFLAIVSSAVKVSGYSRFATRKDSTADEVNIEITQAPLNITTEESCTDVTNLEIIKRNIDRYKKYRRQGLYNTHVNLDLFEGDILNVNASNVTVAVANKNAKWPKGRVPFVIYPGYSKAALKIIHYVFRQYHQKTCVEFVPRTNEQDFIEIRSLPIGCSSAVGRQGGPQTVSLGEGCIEVGVIEHELMHAIGFWHEQSRPDRDKHVIVNWANIRPGMEINFMKFNRSEVDRLGLRYDIGSLMHFGPFDFALNHAFPSIIPRYWYDFFFMGQRKGFSRLDVQKINRFYNWMAGNFLKFSHGEIHSFRIPYDIGSVMHYGPYEFALHPEYPTIMPKFWFNYFYMGQRVGFSRHDLRKINMLYHCKSFED